MHSTKFKFKTKQTLTMETILIITKKEMFSDSSRNYTRNKVRKFKNPFFETFHLTLFIIVGSHFVSQAQKNWVISPMRPIQ